MIVTDASTIAELLLARPQAGAIRRALAPHPELHVPEHFHVEVISVLRRYSIRGELGGARAAAALSALVELRTVTYPVIGLVEAIWERRLALSAYDAAYLALAHTLDSQLITLDRALAQAAQGEGRLLVL